MLYKQRSLPLAVLTQLPLVVCSSIVHIKTGNTHSSGKNKTQMTAKLSSEIAIHGFLLWASMGFLVPVGILVMRKSNREECGRRLKILLYIHGVLQILSVLLLTAGAIMSFINFENAFNNDHQRLGLALYGLVWLQMLVGIIRPHRGSNARSGWFFVHWLLGTAVSVLGIINIYTGLQAYGKKTSRSARIWTILFTVEICLIALLYLFQEKWEYIQKQGVILGNEPVQPTEQEISPTYKQKETAEEPC
ncbi:cytochrome b561 domain-containing protein At4g18260-like [Coffea eugenioides]|uniref:Cytochrome b561 domain-containing protein At4g18260-like n=1 Tax=Coffea arabica TaxID=13443 RepID=A0A6P6SCL2_COFAR|nr:cytochrome b561 domain-containing protein At4g18260-like [Coffea arabica]XP_027170673.1 cytochrome b561 domain-containing protein At4g18260-like [Coffea eugenioides]